MIILSEIYNVDPFNPDATASEQPSSTSEELFSQNSTEALVEEAEREMSFDGRELIGSAMLAPSRDSTSTPDSSRTSSDHTYTTDASLPEFEMVHPPSFQQIGTMIPLPTTHNLASSSANPRATILPPPRPPPSGPLPTRPRNGSLSTLPPPVPPPRVAPPPPPNLPAIVEPNDSRKVPPPSATTRPRGNSTTHTRTGSDNRLEALQEEPDTRPSSRGGPQGTANTPYFRQPHDPGSYPRQHPVDEDGYRASITRPPSQYLIAPQSQPPPPPMKDTPPMPSIPSAMPPASGVTTPSSPTPQTSPMTPRGNSLIAHSHPFSALDPPAHVSRARGISTPTFRSDGYSQASQLIINSNISGGTILQRRSKSSTGTLSSQSSSRSSPPGTALPSPGSMAMSPSTLPVVRLAASSLPASTANSLGIGRSRSSSQPSWPLMGSNSSLSEFGVRPPGPSAQNFPNTQGTLPRKPSFPSRFNPIVQASGAPVNLPHANPSSYLPSSPLPSASPIDPLRKPYHLMSLLRVTMTNKSGGYITRRLHVPHEVWSQGGAKLLNLPEKVRVVEVLCSALEEVQNASNEVASSGSVNGTTSAGGRKDLERWLARLDEWNGACEGVVGSVGKKLGVGEGFGAKKSGGVSLSAQLHG